MVSVGAYELLERLGAGGMGQVWRARPRRGGAEVAIKLLTDARARHPASVRAFAGEIRAVAALEHRNVLRVVDHGVADGGPVPAGSPWLAAELAAGSLAGQGPLPEARVVELLEGILAGLAHAHARGVVHRDIKPSNVLLSARGEPWIADFGLAWLGTERHGSAAGTPAYMAPEQHMGDSATIGPWTDLYAVGCLGFQLLTGRPPFEGGEDLLRQAHLTWPRPAVDSPLGPWLHRMMARSPADRPATAAEARRSLPGAGSPAEDWRRPARAAIRPGLGLFGLRQVPIVGREHERDALWRGLGDAATCGRTVVITGEVGIGKSRLLSWIADRAEEEGRGRAVRLGGGEGIASALRRDLGLLPGASAAQVHGALTRPRPGAHPLIGPALEAVEDLLLAGAGADAAAAALSAWARAAAGDRVAIVTVDDAHLLAETRALCQHQAPGLLVVATWDSTAPGEPLVVGPLPVVAQGRLVSEGLGLRGDLAARVVERTAGNPLFAVKLVGDWVRRGVLLAAPDGYHLDGPEPALPDDLIAAASGALSAVLAEASPSVVGALELAAALSPGVLDDRWRHACAALGLDAIAARTHAIEAGIATAHGDGWRFTHGLVAEALLARVPAARRRAVHRAAAAALPPGAHGRRGRSLLAAGDPEGARPLLVASLQRRLALGELSAAEVVAADLAAAVEASPPVGPTEIPLLLARLDRRRGRVLAARARLLAVLAASEADGDHAGQAVASLELGWTSWRGGRLAEALAHAQHGAHLAHTLDDTELGGRAAEILARVLTDRGELEPAREAWSTALDGARRDGEPGRVAMAQLGLGWLALTRQEPGPARAHVEAALEVAVRARDRTAEGTAHNLLGDIARFEGDLDAATTLYAHAWAHHRAWGAWGAADTAQLNQAIVCVMRDELPGARQHADGVLSRRAGTGAVQFTGAAHLILAVCSGEADRAGFARHLSAAEAELAGTDRVDPDLASLARRAAAVGGPLAHRATRLARALEA